jgi:iron complex transport system ATP-binding protein
MINDFEKQAENVVLHAKNLHIGYKTGKVEKVILKNLSLHLKKGRLVCLIGLNGAGKSTLLKTLSGIIPPLEGEVFLLNEKLKIKTDISQKISLVLTERVYDLRFTVWEMVCLGRYPHLTWNLSMSENDKKIIKNALIAVDSLDLADRFISELSDGQYQKVMLARALAQDTPICILDEPTAHLDVLNRFELTAYLRDIVEQTEKSFLLSTHDLEIALQTAHEIWLILPNGEIKCGTPEDLALNGYFSEIFIRKNIYFDESDGHFKIQNKTHSQKKFAISGNSKAIFWTKKLFEKNGFLIENSAQNPMIVISENENTFKWHFEEQTFDSAGELLHFLAK